MQYHSCARARTQGWRPAIGGYGISPAHAHGGELMSDGSRSSGCSFNPQAGHRQGSREGDRGDCSRARSQRRTDRAGSVLIPRRAHEGQCRGYRALHWVEWEASYRASVGERSCGFGCEATFLHMASPSRPKCNREEGSKAVNESSASVYYAFRENKRRGRRLASALGAGARRHWQTRDVLTYYPPFIVANSF